MQNYTKYRLKKIHHHFQSPGKALMATSCFPLPGTAFCFSAVFSVVHYVVIMQSSGILVRGVPTGVSVWPFIHVTCERGIGGSICSYILVFVHKDSGKCGGAISRPALPCAWPCMVRTNHEYKCCLKLHEYMGMPGLQTGRAGFVIHKDNC